MDISYFKAVQGATGLSHLRDVKIKDAVSNFERQFSSSINFVRDATRNGNPQEFIIVPVKDNKGSRTMCTIYAHMRDELNISDIIRWNGKYWLIIETDKRSQLYNCATMYICDGIVKFCLNDTVYEYPYYVSSIVPSLDGNLQIITSGTTRKIKLPLDEITRQLHNDFRFMGEIIAGVPQIWKITDTTPDNGLLQIVIEKDEYNSYTDDIESGLCDHKNDNIDTFNEQINDDVSGDVVASISGNKELKVGFPRTYTINFLDSNGTRVERTDFHWEVICNFNVQRSIDGDTIELFVDDETNIGEKIILQVLDSHNSLKSEIIITIIDSF